MQKLYCVFSDGSYAKRNRAGLGGVVVSSDIDISNNRPLTHSKAKVETLISKAFEGETNSLSSEALAAAEALNAVPAGENILLHLDPDSLVRLINNNSLKSYKDTCKPHNQHAITELNNAVERHKSVRAAYQSDQKNALVRLCHHFARAAEKGQSLSFETPFYLPVKNDARIIFSSANKKGKHYRQQNSKAPQKQEIKAEAKKRVHSALPHLSTASDNEATNIKSTFNKISKKLEQRYPGYKVKIKIKKDNLGNNKLKVKVKVKVKDKSQKQKTSSEHSLARKTLSRASEKDVFCALDDAFTQAHWINDLLHS